MTTTRTRPPRDSAGDNADRPILITNAPRTYQDEFNERRRRYSLIMALRIPCLILAALLYQVSPWLAGSIVMLSVPLPWIAVLIANDRLPLKPSRFSPHRNARTVIGRCDSVTTPTPPVAETPPIIDVTT